MPGGRGKRIASDYQQARTSKMSGLFEDTKHACEAKLYRDDHQVPLNKRERERGRESVSECVPELDCSKAVYINFNDHITDQPVELSRSADSLI